MLKTQRGVFFPSRYWSACSYCVESGGMICEIKMSAGADEGTSKAGPINTNVRNP